MQPGVFESKEAVDDIPPGGEEEPGVGGHPTAREDRTGSPKDGGRQPSAPGRVYAPAPRSHHIDFAVAQGSDEDGDVLRPILEIGVHDHQDVSPRLAQTDADRGELTDVAIEPQDANRLLPQQVLRGASSAVLGAMVIDEHHFP